MLYLGVSVLSLVHDHHGMASRHAPLPPSLSSITSGCSLFWASPCCACRLWLSPWLSMCMCFIMTWNFFRSSSVFSCSRQKSCTYFILVKLNASVRCCEQPIAALQSLLAILFRVSQVHVMNLNCLSRYCKRLTFSCFTPLHFPFCFTSSRFVPSESPAGSDDPIGFSYCTKDGKVPAVCSWNDTSQVRARLLLV